MTAGPDHLDVPDLLGRVLAPQPPPFALMYRPETAAGLLDVVVGDVSAAESLAGLPVPQPPSAPSPARHQLLALLPFRQIAEHGFACTDDGEPLVTMAITDQAAVTLVEALRRLPDVPIELAGEHFDTPDEAYAALVRTVIEEAIGEGDGANFVIRRSFVADITGYTTAHALAFFRRLLEREQGAYWTFLVHTGERTWVGASPERHVSLHDGTALMNPISGTYRYPQDGPTLPSVLDFLADPKETDELYMVVDEELKMMARVCPGGVRVTGPGLKEMARVAHTEYFIEGDTTRDVRDILRETMFAPTVTGSPLENACRVIKRYEPGGRGYYSGVVALIGHDERGARTLDSAILIRTADIDRSGRVRIGVGATIVRHSDPASEVSETRAKAAGLLAALRGGGGRRFGAHPEVRAALDRRNATVSGFWLAEDDTRIAPDPELAGRSVLVVDAEDTFTSMLRLQLRALGLTVRVRRYDEPYSLDGHDLVVLGPGPGDPRDLRHPKMARLLATTRQLLDERRPFLSICLSHQILAGVLGFPLVRREVPNQGVQREIDLFGSLERVGFYNTFAACHRPGALDRAGGDTVEVSADPETGQVHALRGGHFASMQFHPESLLTECGPRILARTLAGLREGRAVLDPAKA
ncbi:phenazine-specific anthranilate synthase component I [Streptomyces violarus]|uniref:anthranilate synthase n=1 Tax=Streptomyces violarus TaxID=67380 RepID=A0A7W5F338_9ACTN|nr:MULTISPECIES: anthranilate synthase family protein [Streptomyces]MBB3078093.1 phenazine biosynthesis protein phzE [Streptomyces violarus]WRT99751.1 anthranilate synthase family protein [Streptomyces sp. CGMCC 4.1772]GHD19653.1 phenazine-specific anthranilate synthase component I [Streptomyces violarus]